MSDSKLREITDAIDTFDHAMLTTLRDGELRSRPMAIGDTTDDGRIRFITSDDSGKVDEIEDEHEVNVALQGKLKFLSISGKARLTKDQELIDKSWSMLQRLWFSEGRDDPHVMVLEVIPEHVEYWDRRGSNLLRSVFDQALGAFGNADDDGSSDESVKHAEVDLSDKPL